MEKILSASGTVARGEGRATRLGFPTVNLPLETDGVTGIYAALVRIGEHAYPAAAFADPARGLLEAHLIDYAGDLYGSDVTIELYEKIRDNNAFSDDEALKAAIAEDVASVRKFFTEG